MPMDGITIGFAARELDKMLQTGRIDKVSQPEKDTVILLIRADGENRRLLLCASPNNARLHLTHENFPNPLEPPVLCMMLRKHLLGGRVISIRQVHGDRIVYLDIDTINEMGDHVLRRLILEIMGRHSNLILTDENGRILEAARHVSQEMNRVRQIQPGLMYEEPPGQDKMLPESADPEELFRRLEQLQGVPFAKAIGQSVMGLSAVSSGEFAFRVLQSGEDEPQDLYGACQRLCTFLLHLPEIADPCILEDEDGNCLDFYALPYLSQRNGNRIAFPTLSEAMERYYGSRDSKDRLQQKSASMVRVLKNQIERCEKKLALQEEELAGAARMEEYRIMGDIINANLWQMKKGMPEAILDNFYGSDGEKIRIPLDTQLTPAQNAQRYFKKYQKARSARKTAAEQKEKTLSELNYLEGALLDVGKCVGESELEEIRQELAKAGYVKRITSRKQQRDLPKSKPYRYLSSDGIEIWVGKNSIQNERMTMSAKPGEMWLHAKDMPGSHVLIRKEGEIPAGTLKEAAQLAAWYSKGQQSSSVPVDYTLRKYVKKPGGTPAGFVIYTNQHTLFMTVSPKDIQVLKLLEA